MKYTYLLVNLFAVIVPFLFSFHPKIRFDRTWKALFAAMIPVAILFIAWDIAFERMGVWSFNPDYVTGATMMGLPVEEMLFFICIPYACVFTYFCLDRFLKLEWKPINESIFCLAFSALLITAGVIYFDRLYTSITFLSTAVVCIVIKFAGGVRWFGKAVSVYCILLIPFFIVNGILTGTGLEEPVVLYNDSENMGTRLLTIPVEDTIYGFELFLMNLYLYQLLRIRFKV